LLFNVLPASIAPMPHRPTTIDVKTLDRYQQKDLRAGNAKILKCAHCGNESYFGAMNLLSLAILKNKPACGYACNKALGQAC
jgi:hypothetical protein